MFDQLLSAKAADREGEIRARALNLLALVTALMALAYALVSIVVSPAELTLGVIAALATIHMRGLELGSRIQNYLTVGKVGLIVALVVSGFGLGQGDLTNFQLQTTPETPESSWRWPLP